MNKDEITLFFVGIVVGMLLSYALLYGFVVGFTDSAHGIIENVNTTIQINETRLVEAMNSTGNFP